MAVVVSIRKITGTWKEVHTDELSNPEEHISPAPGRRVDYILYCGVQIF